MDFEKKPYHLIQLTKEGNFPNRPDQVYILKEKNNLHLTLSSLHLRQFVPCLVTNLPRTVQEKSKPIYPNSFELKGGREISRKELDKNFTLLMGNVDEEGTWHVEIGLVYTGPLFLQVLFLKTLEGVGDRLIIEEVGKAEWLQVHPRIVINGKEISYRQLSIQSLLPRCLGPASRWKDVLKHQGSLGYNAFHFAPVQSLGFSKSHYSLFDQLDLNKELFTNSQREDNFNQLRDIIKYVEKELNGVCFIDVILNHTAHNSEWILEMNDSYYSPENTPHLRSAVALDLAVQGFSTALIEKNHHSYPKGNIIENEDDIDLIMKILEEEIIPPLDLPSYFICNISNLMSDIRNHMKTHHGYVKLKEKAGEAVIKTNIFAKDQDDILLEELAKIEQNLGAEPRGVGFNLNLLCEHFVANTAKYSYEFIQEVLGIYNQNQITKAQGYLKEASNNLRATFIYRFLTQNKREVTVNYRLCSRYFTILSKGQVAANNGWVMNYNCENNFATSMDFHYLRRNIVIWGDCLKLNYGNSKADSPRLWKRMKQYVQLMASIFHGFRIDNAHSTPINVGEYLLRKARKVNPTLHVFCELFLDSKESEINFVKRLGSNLLLREAIHSRDLKSIVGSLWAFGDVKHKTVGSLEAYHETDRRQGKEFYPLQPRDPLAIFYDQTHDNPTYATSRSNFDCLPMAALLSFSNIFNGTTRGFDEFYQSNLNVATEKRWYSETETCEVTETLHEESLIRFIYVSKIKSKEVKKVELRGSWDNWASGTHMRAVVGTDDHLEAELLLQPGNYFYKYLVDDLWISLGSKVQNEEANHVLNVENRSIKHFTNLCPLRTIFHKYQRKLYEKYPEIYIEEKTNDVLSILREHTSKKKNYTLVTRNAFKSGTDDLVNVKVSIPGKIHKTKFIFYNKDTPVILGDQNSEKLVGNKVEICGDSNIREFADVFYDAEKNMEVIHFTRMPISFVCLIKSKMSEVQQTSLEQTEESFRTLLSHSNRELLEGATVADINYFLFSSENEEKERNPKGCYSIPGRGYLPYQGFAGYFDIVRRACLDNELGNPLFNNLREGHWLLDHLIDRIDQVKSLGLLASILRKILQSLKSIPYHNIPHYFAKLVMFLKDLFEEKALLVSKEFLEAQGCGKIGSEFCKRLLLAQYQFLGEMPSASPNTQGITVAAGLPHFAVGSWRCWGRDTFIAFKGLFLISGLHREGRNTILLFASSLRHGLIPNLLDRGEQPRYNCRDSVWWFVKAVQDYLHFTKDNSLLKEKVKMRFLDDNMEVHQKKVAAGEELVLPFVDILQRIMQAHASGISFTEWNAGTKLDWNMDYLGFNISLRLDDKTGFILGGNTKNCLTWMDKMGSSDKAGTRGVPANPRDGAPIEMTALLKRALEFLIQLKRKGLYPYEGVELNDGKKLSYDDWRTNIMLNFEQCYYIPDSRADYSSYVITPQHVKRGGIYKDTYRASWEKCDYYLRPNSCVALSIAPELFSVKNAELHLEKVRDVLLEPKSLGIKTLDPKKNSYLAYYNNADDSDNKYVAHGFSYHNGPEWVWIYAYYVKAVLNVEKEAGRSINKELLFSLLTNHKQFLNNNEWCSLPEMTNANGQLCEFSCPAQAWSVACILEASYDVLNS